MREENGTNSLATSESFRMLSQRDMTSLLKVGDRFKLNISMQERNQNLKFPNDNLDTQGQILLAVMLCLTEPRKTKIQQRHFSCYL